MTFLSFWWVRYDFQPTWKHVEISYDAMHLKTKQHAYGAAARAVIPHHKVLAKTVGLKNGVT